ncbi:MAG: DUF11 domain-containing protein [Candidatus Aenigmarchaeota archaeon]|nr:DUF11 domain-containing protein [Candidatus Aenigmarchaeota archaeon]
MSKPLLFALVLSALIIASPAYSQPVEISIEPAGAEAMINTQATYQLEITNNQNFPLEAIITVRGPHLEWLSPPDFLVFIPASSSATRTITFYPTGSERGGFNYNIEVADRVRAGVKASTPIVLSVTDPMEIKDFAVRKEGASVTGELSFDSTERQNVNIIFEMIDSSGKKVSIVNAEMKDVLGESTLKQAVPIPADAYAGLYSLKASIKGYKILYDISSIRNFEVEPVRNMIQSESRESNPIYDTVTITVTNQGNVEETGHTVQGSAPSDLVTGFVTNPDGCSDSGDTKTCTYAVGLLKPGESKNIVYRVEYWPRYLPIVTVVVILLVIAAGSYMKFTKPVIRKRTIQKEAFGHAVVLELRNPFRRIKDVFISDFIPHLAAVEEEFEAAKPHITPAQAGTELVWKLGDLSPGDQRILTYRIRSTVRSGLRMPRAQLRYIDSKGVERRIYSNEAVA